MTSREERDWNPDDALIGVDTPMTPDGLLDARMVYPEDAAELMNLTEDDPSVEDLMDDMDWVLFLISPR